MDVFNDLFEDMHNNNKSFAGVMVGVVTNIEDPENMGRIKVRLINRSTADYETDFIRVMTPMSGSDWGMFFLPEVGDEVLVAFGDGDIARPYVLGSLWNNKNKQPAKVKGGNNNTRIIKSKSGHSVTFDDADKEPGIKIKTNQGLLLDLLDKNGGKTITLSDGGSNIIEIKSDNGKGKFEAKTEITIKAGQGTIKLGSSGIELKGGNIKIEGTQVSIKGVSMKVEGLSDLTVSSTGITSVKGTTVMVN